MQARTLPTTHAEVVNFFLETEGGEMEFEAARCRPMLTEDFFAYLKQQIGELSPVQAVVSACMAAPAALVAAVMSSAYCRRLLGACAWCSRAITCAPGEERFKSDANEDRLGELELLQQYLQGAVAKVDAQVASKVAPLERMRRLLTAPDKRATLLEMAGGPVPLHSMMHHETCHAKVCVCLEANQGAA